MYRLIFAFCFFLQPAISHAQPYFQRMYGTANHNQVNTIVATADKGYLIVNRSYDGISSIIKTDSAGSIIWQKRYYTNGANYVHQIVDAVAAPGGYVVVMNTVDTSSVNGEYSEVNILKIDSVGNVIWSTSFIGDGQFGVVATRASCVIATTDGGFMITGSQWEIAATYHPQAMLAKLDQYGSLLWIKTYGIANNSAGWRLTEKLNGNFLVAGPAWGLSLSWNFVLETDSTGNGLWSKKYESWSSQGSDWNLGSLNDVIVTDDAGFVITGDPLVLIKCDSIGNVQWHKDTHWVWGNRVLQLQDGSYVVGGASMQGYPDNDALLARFDSTGSPLWWRRYGDATDNVALALVQTSGGYTLGGFTNGYNEDAYLVSVDSSGFGNCPFNISITDTTGNYTLTTGPSDGFGNATIESVNIPHVFVAVVTTDTTSEVICTCPMPVASFEIDTIVPGTYQFSSNSMNAVWNWDFGDGTYDTTAVALHTFDTLGLYTVCLNVTNNCGSDQTCINISYCQRPVSSFQIFMVDSSTIGLVDVKESFIVEYLREKL